MNKKPDGIFFDITQMPPTLDALAEERKQLNKNK